MTFATFLHLLYRIFTFNFLSFINWCATWSFSSWLKQIMVTCVYPDIKDLFLICAFLFTASTCWGLLFLLLPNVCLLSSLIWLEFDSLRLLNACLWDSLFFFNIFWSLCLRSSVLLISELIISFPCCHVFLQITFPFLFFGYSYCFIIICGSTATLCSL